MRYLQLLAPIQKELISLALALATALILWLFRARARLYWGRTHSFTFWIQPETPTAPPGITLPAPPDPPPQSFLATTTSFFVANIGREAATNVEITFNWQPNNHQIWPVRTYEMAKAADGRFTLKFATMSPKENFQIELLTVGKSPDLMNVRCDECIGKEIPMRAMRVLPAWMHGLVWILVFLGVAAVVYIVLSVAGA